MVVVWVCLWFSVGVLMCQFQAGCFGDVRVRCGGSGFLVTKESVSNISVEHLAP